VKIEKKIINSLVLMVVMFLSTCGSSSVKDNDSDKIALEREKAILKQYSESRKEKYADLLVDVERYTTRGGYFQKKYYKYLIGVAGDITENKNLKIGKGSIGFYFDKKSNKRDRLYLGLDVNLGAISSTNYNNVAIALLKEHIRPIVNTINSCKTLFEEKEIIGMVIGFKWTSPDYNEQVNIWIVEDDVFKFENNKLTFDELIQRSTITNTTGKIVRLPI